LDILLMYKVACSLIMTQEIKGGHETFSHGKWYIMKNSRIKLRQSKGNVN